MKQISITLLLCLVTILSYGQTKHLTIMGSPIAGNITTFQQKLLAKNYRVDARRNKVLPDSQREFKGRFSGQLRERTGNRL